MSQFFRRPFPLALLLALGASGASLAAGADVVELPEISVNGTAPVAPGPASVVATGLVLAGDSAFSDLARQTAGLAVNDSGAHGFGETVTLRGLGNTPFFSDASAPVYLDDIPLGSVFTFPSELYAYDQLAVHRGPQAAAQFGRAGDGGVLQFSSGAPGASSRAEFGATVGDYAARVFSLTAQTARSEGFDAAVHLGSSRRDGYIENTQLHTPVDSRDALFGRITLHSRPDKDWEVSVDLLGERTRDGAQALVPLGGPHFTVNRGKEGVIDADFTAVALGVARKLDGATLKATTSYTDWNLSPYSNRLVVFGGANLDSAITQAQRTFNEEWRYVSATLTGGAFFSHAHTEGSADRTISGFPIENSRFALGSDSYAVFGQALLKPSAEWLITPGLRLEHDAKGFSRTEVVPAKSLIRRDDNWTAVLPSVAATRHLAATTDLTFTLARGFKPGGYSAYTGVASLTGYDPQTTWGLEAALQTAAKDGTWAVAARAYAYRVSGYQIERSFAVPNTGTDEYLVVNARRARSLGLEIESTWRPAANVTVGAVAGLTDVTLQEFSDPFTGANYSGDRAPYAPSGNAALRIAYRPARGLFAGAGLTWTGRTFYDERETAAFAQPAYSLVDAQVGYAFARGEIRVFARNLADKQYYSAITPGVGHGTPGAPFTWGGAIAFRW